MEISPARRGDEDIVIVTRRVYNASDFLSYLGGIVVSIYGSFALFAKCCSAGIEGNTWYRLRENEFRKGGGKLGSCGEKKEEIGCCLDFKLSLDYFGIGCCCLRGDLKKYKDSYKDFQDEIEVEEMVVR